ncbi:MAG: proton-conducting transporter membrane subunit [Pseudomonadota bacterium]
MTTLGLAPVFLIIVPLTAAFLAVVAPWPRVLVIGAVPLMLALTVALVMSVWRDGPISIAIGGWQAPLGIELAAGGLAASFLATTTVVMTIIVLVALPAFGNRHGETRTGWAFWPLAFMMWAALNAVFLSGDLFNIYVAIEFLTLATLALVALEGKAGTIEAAMRYAIFALFGSLAYLLGVVLLYAAHGTLDLDLLAAATKGDSASLVGAALITAGLAAKTALFPFHAWLPPAHAGAPAPASAMLSALVPKASFFVLVQFWFVVMPEAAGPLFVQLIGVLGAAAILYGSLLAIRQTRLKRLIAYSTVAQIGYLFLVFPLAGGDSAAQPWSAGAWTGAMLQAIAHALAKGAMFLAAGLVVEAAGHDRLSAVHGLARTMPITAFTFALSSVTLMGLPPSGGFVAKYLMLTSAFASGQIVWALVILTGGLLAAAYLFRVLAPTFLRSAKARADIGAVRQALPLTLAATSILLGLLSAQPFEFLQIGRPQAATGGLQ